VLNVKVLIFIIQSIVLYVESLFANIFLQLLITDGRVTIQGTTDLLAQTQCDVWITTHDGSERGNDLVKERMTLRVLIIPSVEYFLEDEKTAHYPYAKTWDEAKSDVIYIIHTSGTTGNMAKSTNTYLIEVTKKCLQGHPNQSTIRMRFLALLTAGMPWLRGTSLEKLYTRICSQPWF
jgi:hypothetical protein